MKKFFPFIIIIVGFLVLVGAFIFIRNSKDNGEEAVEVEEVALIEVSLVDRPVVKLTPRSDGHWLDLEISKLGKFEAESLEYEFLYKVSDGRTQGTPGRVMLDGQEKVERELLLGTESSGNYYYDDGVEEGVLTLRFRNEDGKLLVKFVSSYHIQTDIKTLSSLDGSFTYEMDDEYSDYFVTMDTIGYPDGEFGVPKSGPFGIFTSSRKEVTGTSNLEGDVYVYIEDWEKVDAQSVPGIFVSVSSINESSE